MSRALPAQLQPPHLGVGEQPVRRQLLARGPQLGRGGGRSTPRHPPPPWPAGDPAASTATMHLAEGQERGLGKHPDEVEPRVALQDGAQLVAALQRLQRRPVRRRARPRRPRGAGPRWRPPRGGAPGRRAPPRHAGARRPGCARRGRDPPPWPRCRHRSPRARATGRPG